ncbi:hypothetical protein NFJ02_34g86520 [Pycnococcus provasolii]
MSVSRTSARSCHSHCAGSTRKRVCVSGHRRTPLPVSASISDAGELRHFQASFSRTISTMQSHWCRRSSTKAHAAAGGAAAAGGGDDDPYAILGCPEGSDTDAINRAYKSKLAQNRGNKDALDAIESAHSRILMRQLTDRMSGKSSAVSKEVAFADNYGVYTSAPWLPRWAPSPRNEAIVNGVIALVCIAWALKSPYAQLQPVITAAIIFVIRLVQKLGRYGEASSPSASREEQSQASSKRLARGFLMTFGSLGMALILVKWLPNALAESTSFMLPRWYMLNITTITNVVPIAALFVAATLFR